MRSISRSSRLTGADLAVAAIVRTTLADDNAVPSADITVTTRDGDTAGLRLTEETE